MKTSPGLGTRTVDRFFQRVRQLPPARNEYAVERGLHTPTRDGAVFGAVLVEIENQSHLNKVIKAIRRVKGVTEVARHDAGPQA